MLKEEPLHASGALKKLLKLQTQRNIEQKASVLLGCGFTSKSKAQGPNTANFTLQISIWLNLISGFLQVERRITMIEQKRGSLMGLCAYVFNLYDLELSLCMILIKDIFTNFSNHSRRPSLSENIIFSLTST